MLESKLKGNNMSLFSQRKGLKPLQKAIQRESMDDELRNCLWSGITTVVWSEWKKADYLDFKTDYTIAIENAVAHFWVNYFKKPLDTLEIFNPPRHGSYLFIRDYFFQCKWNEAYDFIEFMFKSPIPNACKEDLIETLNGFLEKENSAYRIINDEVVEITDEMEISEIETALDKRNAVIKTHLETALVFLSDRQKPDYRNSIKESISAVEAACQIISGKAKVTLPDCLKALKDKQPLHPAFEQALLKLYGYTSDAQGIRHALIEDTISLSYADAKFMLVSCSSFINYLWTRVAELGITIKNEK